MVKEMKEMFERQNSEDVGKVIKGQRSLIETNDRRRIERYKDEGVIRRKLEKEIGKDDSPRNNDSLKDKLYERQNNEMVRRMLYTKEIERDSEKVVNNGRKNIMVIVIV